MVSGLQYAGIAEVDREKRKRKSRKNEEQREGEEILYSIVPWMPH